MTLSGTLVKLAASETRRSKVQLTRKEIDLRSNVKGRLTVIWLLFLIPLFANSFLEWKCQLVELGLDLPKTYIRRLTVLDSPNYTVRFRKYRFRIVLWSKRVWAFSPNLWGELFRLKILAYALERFTCWLQGYLTRRRPNLSVHWFSLFACPPVQFYYRENVVHPTICLVFYSFQVFFRAKIVQNWETSCYFSPISFY